MIQSLVCPELEALAEDLQRRAQSVEVAYLDPSGRPQRFYADWARVELRPVVVLDRLGESQIEVPLERVLLAEVYDQAPDEWSCEVAPFARWVHHGRLIQLP